jgi:predicted metal-dependent hydrolase
MQHGAPFWKEFEKYMPDAKALRKQMGAYQPALSPTRGSMA